MGKTGALLHIDDVSRRLAAWLSQVLPDAEVDFPNRFSEAMPPKKVKVSARFHAITMEKMDRATLNPERQFVLSYELDVTAKTAFEQHRAYSEIYFSAYEDKDWQVEAGVRASAESGPMSMRLNTKIPRRSVQELAPPVRSQMNVSMTGLGRITGQVTSGEGIPIPRAYVEAPSLGRRLMTDKNGRFVFDGAPTAGAVFMSVTARGRVVHLSVDAASTKELAVIMAMEEENA